MNWLVLASSILSAAGSAAAAEVPVNKVLIVYGSRNGSTAEVAGRMRDGLRAAGCAAETMAAAGQAVDFSGCALVVIGSGIYGGRPHADVAAFVAANRAALAQLPVAAFAVCATAVSSNAGQRRRAQEYPAAVGAGLRLVNQAVFGGVVKSSGWFANLAGRVFLGITPGDHRDWARIARWTAELGRGLTPPDSAARSSTRPSDE